MRAGQWEADLYRVRRPATEDTAGTGGDGAREREDAGRGQRGEDTGWGV